jgi:predicted 2-oxoglutarate/Fe(II)-dependent dioxygenase YbiX
MKLNNFIKIYDEIMPWEILSNFLKYINKVNFEPSKIINTGNPEGSVDFNIRRTFVYTLNDYHQSLTNVHWYNLIKNYFNKNLNKYKSEVSGYCFWDQIIDISVLKYENNGFFTWHTDDAAEIPRTLSCILLLNNDYEGGNLCFKNPDGTGEWEVEVKPNRMIIWPSNFLYPHTVKPVMKGKRYSVVAWAR